MTTSDILQKLAQIMQIKCFLLTLMVATLPTKAHEVRPFTDFFGEHFIKNSVAVMVSGVIYSALIESVCYEATVHHHQRPLFCMTFAAESINFIYLVRTQLPVNSLDYWESINLLLVMGASALIEATEVAPETFRKAMLAATCHQVGKISARIAARNRLKSLMNYREVVNKRAKFNGVSSGVLIGSTLLWLTNSATMSGFVSPVVAFLSASNYLLFIDSQALSYSEIAKEGAQAGIFAGVLTLSITGGTVRVRAVAGILAGVGATASALVGAAAIAQGEALYEALWVVIATAIAEILIISVTRYIVDWLSDPLTDRISGKLALIAVTGVPFLLSSWLVSLDQFLEFDVPANESMQAVFYPLSSIQAVLDDLIDILYFNWPWFTDDQTDNNPDTARPDA